MIVVVLDITVVNVSVTLTVSVVTVTSVLANTSVVVVRGVNIKDRTVVTRVLVVVVVPMKTVSSIRDTVVEYDGMMTELTELAVTVPVVNAGNCVDVPNTEQKATPKGESHPFGLTTKLLSGASKNKNKNWHCVDWDPLKDRTYRG